MPLNIKEPHPHRLMPQPTHDEHARENVNASIKHFLSEKVYPFDELVYEKKAKPHFEKEHGREPKDCGEVHRLMMGESYTQMWSSIARTMQEMLWDNTGEMVWRQHDTLKQAALGLKEGAKGTLSLDPNFEMPTYIEAIDIHAMPGGYSTDLGHEDLFTAAVYERGAYYYTGGRVGQKGQGAGTALVNAVKEFFPEHRPRRILDIGCAIGWSTLCLVDAWPDAEVHGIDVGAPFMRYAHARAESMEKVAHFHQMSGEHLKFPDGYFDLVITGALFHETSKKAAPAIMREIYRVLEPGGVSMNYDIPYAGEYNLHEQFMLNWDCFFNAEPFWREWTSWDRPQFMGSGGFDVTQVVQAWADRDRDGTFKLFPTAFDDLRPSARGGIGRVHFFGCRKGE